MRRPADISRLLGIGTPGAWVLVTLFGATYATLTVLSARDVLLGPAGFNLLVTAGAALFLMSPAPDPLPWWRVVIGVAVVQVVTLVAIGYLEPVGWPGWRSWNFGACTFLMFALALRGRPLAGFLGVLGMAGIAVAWTALTVGDPLHGLVLTYQQIVSYAAGALIRVVLARAARRIAQFHETESARAAWEARAAAGARELAEQLSALRREAGPVLHRIATGRVTPEERRTASVVEAELRDRLRGRRIAHGELVDAARRARVRGRTVWLLDDADGVDLADSALSHAVRAAAAAVARSTADSITVRLARHEGGVAITVADDVAGATVIPVGETSESIASDARGA